MLVWINRIGRRPIIAFAVMAALVLTNLGIVLSHHPVGDPTAIHHGDIFAHSGGHDHDSDDSDTDNEDGSRKLKGTTLGHNATDHSHVTAGAPPAGISVAHIGINDWQAIPVQFADAKAHFNHDRPPKAAFFA